MEVDVGERRGVTFADGNHPSLSPGLDGMGGRPLLQKKKSSLKTVASKKRLAGSSVSFHETVTVRELPSDEAEEAKNTRKGAWDAAPEHDELWDGHTKDFWDQEKTIEEVRRIVVIRQMRKALEYNLGYAFYSMVANFKKRNPVDEDAVGPGLLSPDEDVVPQYETPTAEETAIRKEIRELFGDSVKGLDFPELVQDREAFDKIYASTTINISEAKRVPGLGLLRIEELVDEIMNAEEICRMLGVKFVPKDTPQLGQAEIEAQEKIDNAVGVEEKRRGDRRASIEAQNHVFAERRVSVEARRRASLEPLVQPQELGSISQNGGRRPSVEASSAPDSASAGRRSSFQTESVPDQVRRPSLLQQQEQGRRGSVQAMAQQVDTQARRTSLTQSGGNERRSSLQPIVTDANANTRRPSLQVAGISSNADSDDPEPIFAGSGRAAVHGHHGVVSKKVAMQDSHEVESSSADTSMKSVPRRELPPASAPVAFARILLGLVLHFVMASQRSFHVNSAIEFGRTNVKGSGPLVYIVPLLIILAFTLVPIKR